MRNFFILTAALFCIGIAQSQAQTPLKITDVERLKPIIVDLWPNGAPNDNGLTGPEKEFANGRL